MEAQEQPRNGGRFAAKAKPKPPAPARIPTPVHDQLAAMKAKRQASPGGFMIEPPVSIEQLNTIGTVRHGVAITPEGRELASVELVRHLYAWLRQIAEEGLLHDLDIAWRAFDPPVSAVKTHHRSIYDELYPKVLHRGGQLSMQREKEQQALNAAEGKRRAIELAREALAKFELELEVEMPAKLAAMRQALVEMEARA